MMVKSGFKYQLCHLFLISSPVQWGVQDCQPQGVVWSTRKETACIIANIRIAVRIKLSLCNETNPIKDFSTLLSYFLISSLDRMLRDAIHTGYVQKPIHQQRDCKNKESSLKTCFRTEKLL